MKRVRVPECEEELPTTKMTATLRREILATVNRKIVRKRRPTQPKEQTIELDAGNLEEVKESGVRLAAKPPPLPTQRLSSPPRRPSLSGVSLPPPLPKRPSLLGMPVAPPSRRPSLPAVSVPPPLPSPRVEPTASEPPPLTRRSRPSLVPLPSPPPVQLPQPAAQEEEIPLSVAPLAEPARAPSVFVRHRLSIILCGVTVIFLALLAAAAAVSGASY